MKNQNFEELTEEICEKNKNDKILPLESYESKREETRFLFEKCSRIFIALGDKIRQNLILDIADAGKPGISVANLAAKSNLSRPAISHHLKVLKDSNLLVFEKKGTQMFYKLNIAENIDNIKKLVSGIEALENDVE